MAEPIPYRLSLSPALEARRPEIEYVFDVLERWYALARRPEAERVVHYGVAPPPGAVAIPAVFFPECVVAGEDGIRLDRARFAIATDAGAPAPLLPCPGREAGRLAYDAVGLIFFLLSRIEERDHPSLDRYGRFPHEAAFAVARGGYARPAADVAARDLAALIAGGAACAARTKFAIRLTHDVDRFRGYHRAIEPLRSAAGDLLKRGRPRAALRRLAESYGTGEPWRSFRDVMELSERGSLRSHFYFMGPSELAMDSPYVVKWPRTLKALADEIAARGHAIGFHPGFATATDAQEWRRQKAGLEAVIGRPVEEGRQHVLRYRIDTTPEIWSDAGMALDLTLGFPEGTGFRSGTCRRYPAYSLARRRRLALDRLDTPVMDFGLFGGKYRDLSIDAALAEALAARDVCREFAGECVVLFHTGQARGMARAFYGRLMEAVA